MIVAGGGRSAAGSIFKKNPRGAARLPQMLCPMGVSACYSTRRRWYRTRTVKFENSTGGLEYKIRFRSLRVSRKHGGGRENKNKGVHKTFFLTPTKALEILPKAYLFKLDELCHGYV